ncbi:MAG: hypothetical protein AXA67_11965 [Methylothermaceae bacteria B42]|nr:MAG: hypothetical protein AXA67_11965 [Methylothermaceae bacteria B42]HHJ39246.1 hypothetical protein [Methylothermaceae bacterium]
MSGWFAAFAIASVAFLGALAAGFVPRYLPTAKPSLWTMVSAVAAGLLLASAMVIVIPEGFEVLFLSHESGQQLHSDSFLGLPPVLASGLAILGGFLLMLGLETFGLGHEMPEEQGTVQILSIGLGLHALTDGLAIGASLATGLLALTLPILAAVMVHKIPVAFGLGVFLWQKEGDVHINPLRTLLLFSAATPMGLLITFLFLRQLPHEWIGLMLLLSGGTFLYVATVDVLSKIKKEQSGKVLLQRVGAGAILVIASLIIFQMLGLEAEFHG